MTKGNPITLVRERIYPKYSTDAEFKWGDVDYGQIAKDWIGLAREFIKTRGKIRGGDYVARIHGLSIFIRRYIAVHGFWSPET